jgi:hypothetical protein
LTDGGESASCQVLDEGRDMERLTGESTTD